MHKGQGSFSPSIKALGVVLSLNRLKFSVVILCPAVGCWVRWERYFPITVLVLIELRHFILPQKYLIQQPKDHKYLKPEFDSKLFGGLKALLHFFFLCCWHGVIGLALAAVIRLC